MTSLSNPSSRRPDIQGLRAVAVLLVVAYHAGVPFGGFLGVDVFFVISGFVITGMLAREWSATGRLALGRFYVRRFQRLTPAVVTVVAFTVIVSAIVLSPLGGQATAAETAIGAILISGNFVIAKTTGGYFDAPAALNPLLHTWSLSVEEQFYLIFPATLLIAWTLARHRPRLRFAAGAAVAIIFCVSLALALSAREGWIFSSTSTTLGFYSPVVRAWEFAAGALLAMMLHGRAVPGTRLGPVAAFAGVALLAFALLTTDASTPWPGIQTLSPVFATALLIFAGTAEAGTVRRLLSSRPLSWIGDRSYSIYLWHWPFIVFTGLIFPGNVWAIAAAAVVSVVPATLSFRWVEQPFRSWRPPTRARLARAAAVLLIPVLVLSGGLLFATDHALGSPQVRSLEAAVVPGHEGRAAGCDTGVSSDQRPESECLWNPSEIGVPIYLVGDSNADHFSEAIIGAGAELNRPVRISTTNTCPFLDVTFSWRLETSAWNTWCADYVQRELEYLRSAPRGLVIISNVDHYFSTPDFLIGTTGSAPSAEEGSKLAALRTGLAETVASLEHSGQQVLLVQTVPQWTDAHAWSPQTCSAIVIITSSCVQNVTVREALHAQGPVRVIVASVARDEGASVLDSWKTLCTDGTCSTQSGSLVHYRDPSHISVPQSIAMVPEFRRAITSAG